MTLEQIYLVSQIVAAIAVVCSLSFVGYQLRQSTRATRLASIQAVEAAIGRTEELIIQDAGFAEILMHGMNASVDELGDTARIRLNVFYRHALRTYQSAHYQFLHGALDESVWEPQTRGLGAVFQADQGFRAHFDVERYMLDPTFATLCDQLLADSQRWVLTSANDPVSRD